MMHSKVKIDKVLLARAAEHVAAAGYASVEELVNHALEQALAKLEEAASEDEMRKRLKGLGYLS